MTSSTTRKNSAVIVVDKLPFFTRGLVALAKATNLDCVIIADHEREPLFVDDPAVTWIPTDNWGTDRLRALVASVAQGASIRGMLTCQGQFTGEGLLAAQVAEIARELGVSYTPPEAIWQAHNKFLARRALQKAGVHTVAFHRVIDEPSIGAACKHVGFPLILKPVTGGSSSFVYRCTNEDEMRTAYRHFLAHVPDTFFFQKHVVIIDGETFSFDPRKELLAEGAIDGPELSVECVATNESVFPLMIHDKLDVEETAYCVYENLLVTPPVRIDAEKARELKAYAVSVNQAVGLRNAFSHVEIRIDAMGRPSLLEINPRIGGMQVIRSLEDVLGFVYGKAVIDIAIGKPLELPQGDLPISEREDGEVFGMMALYPRSSGVLSKIDGLEAARAIPGVRTVRSGADVGTHVSGEFEEVFAVDAFFSAKTIHAVRAIDTALREAITINVA